MREVLQEHNRLTRRMMDLHFANEDPVCTLSDCRSLLRVMNYRYSYVFVLHQESEDMQKLKKEFVEYMMKNKFFYLDAMPTYAEKVAGELNVTLSEEDSDDSDDSEDLEE